MSFAAIFSRRGDRQKKERERQAAIADDAERLRMEQAGKNDDALLSAEPEKPNYGAFKQRAYGQQIDFAVIDDIGNLKQALKAYDALYWIFTNEGRYPGKAFSMAYKAIKFMQKPLPMEGSRIVREKILEISCIDWCVAAAFGSSSDHIGKVCTYINNQILVSALLMSVTAPLFISPPAFDNEWFNIITSAVLGLATFFQLFNLVAFTALLNMINGPYVASLTMLARVEAEFYLNFLNILVYAGVLMFMAAMLFVAYVGNVIDLYIMTPVVLLIFGFCYILYSSSWTSAEFRRESVFNFYERYCEYDGRLKTEFMNMVYADYESLEYGGPVPDDGKDMKNAIPTEDAGTAYNPFFGAFNGGGPTAPEEERPQGGGSSSLGERKPLRSRALSPGTMRKPRPRQEV